MEFRPLRAFVEVVRQGGFSQAAAVLFSTQSTVSKAVKQLEEECGILLLERQGHRNRLTEAGEMVYRRGVKLLAERDDLLAELAEFRGLRRGSLRLGLPAVGSSALFAQLFALYRQRYPAIEVSLIELGSEQLEERLRAGQIDVAGALLPTSAEFESQPVRSEPMVALLAEGHPLARRRGVSLGELRETPLVIFDRGFGLHSMIIEACRRAGFEPVIAARSTQIDFMIELVGAGLGVAFLPRMVAAARRQAGIRQVVLRDPAMEWRMALIWRRGGYLSAAAEAWLALVRETRENG